VLMVIVKGVTLSSCAWARRCALFCGLYTYFRVFLIWFSYSFRVGRSGLWLFSCVLAVMVFLKT